MQAARQQVQSRVREMTWDEFEKEFCPIMDFKESTFRAFTKSDWEFLKARSNTHPGTVWTFMDDGEGGTFIGDGLHYVNALHWHVTEMPAADPDVTYIVDHDPCTTDEDNEGLDIDSLDDASLEERGTGSALTDTASLDTASLGFAMEVSLDGGMTWQKAPEGVRVLYKGVHVDGEDGRGEVHLNCTHSGLITDIWSCEDENIGTDCVFIDDIVMRLVKEND